MRKEFKGTKGEWKVGKHPSTVVSTAKVTNTNFPSPPNSTESKDDEIEHYGGYLVAESIGDKADAKLMAAAPDMLEALMIINGDIERGSNRYTSQEIKGIVEKAINKALKL